MTALTTLVNDQARKFLSARFEILLTESDPALIDGSATEEERDWLASSIASEPDPDKRKRLVREVLDSGLKALQDGQELARQVLGT